MSKANTGPHFTLVISIYVLYSNVNYISSLVEINLKTYNGARKIVSHSRRASTLSINIAYKWI